MKCNNINFKWYLLNANEWRWIFHVDLFRLIYPFVYCSLFNDKKSILFWHTIYNAEFFFSVVSVSLLRFRSVVPFTLTFISITRKWFWNSPERLPFIMCGKEKPHHPFRAIDVKQFFHCYLLTFTNASSHCGNSKYYNLIWWNCCIVSIAIWC